jgi:hypothetical protein
MEDFDPAEDYVSTAARTMMDTAFGLNGMARFIASEAQVLEHRERARLRQQRHRAADRRPQESAHPLQRDERLTG